MGGRRTGSYRYLSTYAYKLYTHSPKHTHNLTLCIDRVRSVAPEEHRHLHQCQTEGEVGGVEQREGLEKHGGDAPLDADELRRRRLLHFQQ